MRILGENDDIDNGSEKTKNKILLASARLFAIRGYTTVSMREIAIEAGIQPSAIYNHYKGKEAVLDAILEHEIAILAEYYSILEQENQEAETFEKVVYNLFTELKDVTSQFSYYALCIALNTQFLFEKARTVYYDLFLMEGRAVYKKQLDVAIEKGLVESFDTVAISAFLISSVITGNTIRAGQFNGYYMDFDFHKWYTEQTEFILHNFKINIK